MNSNLRSTFAAFNAGRRFGSVLGILGLKYLPENLHGMQLSLFLSRFCELRPPEMFRRRRHFVNGGVSFVQE